MCYVVCFCLLLTAVFRAGALHPPHGRLARHLRAPSHHSGPPSTWHLRARGRGRMLEHIRGQNAAGTCTNSHHKGLSTRLPSYTISQPDTLKSFLPSLYPQTHHVPTPFSLSPLALAPRVPSLFCLSRSPPISSCFPRPQVHQASSSSCSCSSSPPVRYACNSDVASPSYGVSSVEGRVASFPHNEVAVYTWRASTQLALPCQGLGTTGQTPHCPSTSRPYWPAGLPRGARATRHHEGGPTASSSSA
jgi:hypothetical protein